LPQAQGFFSVAMSSVSVSGLEPAIVVTGASSGIGRALAHAAAKDAKCMVLLGRSQPALAELAAELAPAVAIVATISIDLQDKTAVTAIEAELAARGWYCDVLINSAGYGLYGAAAEADAAGQLGILDVNARALTELTLRFLPGMIARKRGGVLNVGSVTGFVPGPHMAVYYATKAYVYSFSNALAMETAGSGVVVTCLAPGVVRTGFFEVCEVGSTRISKLYPRMNAPDVAEQGWRAFKQGRRVVVPGLANRAIAAMLRLMPEPIMLNIVRVLQAPRRS
jgi:uncharacterized protein